MTAFAEASEVEREAFRVLLPYASKFADRGTQIVQTTDYLFVQKIYGDLILRRNGQSKAIEVKAEKENRHGNLFIETWSNRRWFRPGWIITSEADFLWYYFVGSDELFSVPLEHLKQWCFGGGAWERGNVYEFPEKAQAKYDQRNDTWGRCVPIDYLREIESFKGPFNAHEQLNAA